METLWRLLIILVEPELMHQAMSVNQILKSESGRNYINVKHNPFGKLWIAH